MDNLLKLLYKFIFLFKVFKRMVCLDFFGFLEVKCGRPEYTIDNLFRMSERIHMNGVVLHPPQELIRPAKQDVTFKEK